MKKIMLFFILISSGIYTASAQRKLVKIWETDSTLKVPESVLYDAANQVLYVSNIDGAPDGKDGKGSIGKVGLDGKIVAVDWVSGLNAPKGMALVKGVLWVSDLDEVVTIDIHSGKITRKIKVEGATFLNDVAAGPDGAVYVSDSRNKTVHRVDQEKPTLYLENLQGPNGLLVHNNQLHVLDNGSLHRVEQNKSLTKIADGMEGNTDGLENVQGNEFLVSCWAGVMYYVKEDGSKEKLLDTRDQKINSADIGYDASKRIVYVPTFFRNSVVAYQLQ